MLEMNGKRVTVMGLGRFGGGVGVTRWLAARGAEVLVTDASPAESLKDSLQALEDLIRTDAVRTRLGEHNVSDFTSCDVLVVNPAVPKPWENRFVRSAHAAGAAITTEIGLLAERLPADRVIGVTGAAGKSTTSALIHAGLTGAGAHSLLGGNIGGSLLLDLDTLTPSTWVVLELSSFMLYWLSDPGVSKADFGTGAWSPHISVVTSFAPNHLDWHETLDHYALCKQAVLRRQRPGDSAILGPRVPNWPTNAGVTRREISCGLSGMAIPGTHNACNGALALAACAAALGDSAEACREGIRRFAGLPHRLQFVCAARGVRCFNDSKATTPDAALLALDALAPAPIHLIAGGYDKGLDLTPIARRAQGLAGLYTIGATGDALAAAALTHAPGARVQRAGTLPAAVQTALDAANPGDALLLSPGCASWDQFENYEKRGEAFIRLVRSVGT